MAVLTPAHVQSRLEYLRAEIENERISARGVGVSSPPA